MLSRNLKELSKIISHALRHQPSLYGLKPDKDGWVDVGDLIKGVKDNTSKYDDLSKMILIKMIEESPKKRHKIEGNRIRALYGHSLKEKIIKVPSTPPEVLFHGTKEGTITDILKSGLLPMKRQYVHLSENMQDAFGVALRKTKAPVILRIKSFQASQNGVRFYEEGNGLWLSEEIPAKYVEINKTS